MNITEKNIIAIGKEVLADSKNGIILPPIFIHSAIEVLEHEQKMLPKNKSYLKRQASNEMEMSVYNILTTFLEGSTGLDYTLMHSFEYNYDILNEIGIYGIIEKQATVKEHDFILVVDSVFVIIEVKSSVKSAKNEQLNTASNLITKVCEKYQIEEPVIVKVKSVPEKIRPPGSDGDSFRLFEDSMTDEGFSKWWKDYIDEKIKSATYMKHLEKNYKDVKNMLVGIWATGLKSKTRRDISNYIGCVQHIDDRLKFSKLCQGTKATLMNPFSIFPIDNIQDISKDKNTLKKVKELAEYVTLEQKDLLSNPKYKRCFISGPAGSGKTVAMLINIMVLYHQELPITVITSDETFCKMFKEDLEKSGVKAMIFPSSRNEQSSVLSNFDNTTGSNVVRIINAGNVTVEMINTLEIKTGHIFIDNLQDMYFSYCIWMKQFIQSNFQETVESDQRYFWVFCDETQCPYIYNENPDELTKPQKFISNCMNDIKEKVNFRSVVRNTKQIGNACIELRKAVSDMDGKLDSFRIEEIKPFHLINGPKPRLHILKYDDEEKENFQYVENYINQFKEKHRITNGIGERNKFAEGVEKKDQRVEYIVTTNYRRVDTNAHLQHLLQMNCDSKTCENLMALEYTAVLGIIDMESKGCNDIEIKKQMLYRLLYLIISRARVIADVIMILADDDLFEKERFQDVFEIVKRH